MTSVWRNLSEDEWRRRHGHRLAGGLRVMVWLSAAIVVYALASSLSGRGPFRLGELPLDTAPRIASFTARLLFYIAAGAIVFVTLLRLSGGPVIVTTLAVAWAIAAEASTIIWAAVMAQTGFEIPSIAALLPTMAFIAALAGTVCIYMLQGYQPNLYFRRRIRI